MSLNNLLKLSDSLKEEILKKKKDCLQKFPIEKYIEALQNYPKISSYRYVSPEIEAFCRNLRAYAGDEVLDLFHRLILIDLIIRIKQNHIIEDLPEDIHSLYETNFKRIVKGIESAKDQGAYSHANDRFHKDIALCDMKMIPAGAQKIHLQRVSKRFLLKGGVSQFIKGLYFVSSELGGFSPLFEMHTDSNDSNLMSDFNEEGWKQFYQRVSRILKKNTQVKGIFGSSWFFDPVLENISPRLVYLRKIVSDNGGKLFYLGSNDQAVKDATLKSPTRRKLYEEGKYTPTRYLLIWPREKLIFWADNNSID